jgi:hypothetical protein
MTNSLPPYRIETCVPDKREPGMMVFNVRPGGSADEAGGVGWIIGVDQAGKIPLDLKFDKPSQDVRALRNGNLLFSLTSAGILMETTRAGKTVCQWHIAGKWKDKTPPAGSVEIDVELTHHAINVFPNGNFLLLSAEMRLFPDWPANDTEQDAPRGDANVVGDVILEVSREGKVIDSGRCLICWTRTVFATTVARAIGRRVGLPTVMIGATPMRQLMIRATTASLSPYARKIA